MARIVTITQARDRVGCSPEGHAEQVFTVTNTSGAPLRIGAQVLPDEPAQASWMTIEGQGERDLAVNASDQVRVQVQVPADVSPGQYTFRLLVFSAKRPGEDYTESETVAFEVPPKAQPAPPPPTPKSFPWWIPAVIAIVLIGGGVTWWLWPSDEKTPPDTEQPPVETEALIREELFQYAQDGGQLPFTMSWNAIGPDRRYSAQMDGTLSYQGDTLVGRDRMSFSNRPDDKQDDVEFQIRRNGEIFIILHSWGNTKLDLLDARMVRAGNGYMIKGETREGHGTVTDVTISISKS